jgi:hypothetical protein
MNEWKESSALVENRQGSSELLRLLIDMITALLYSSTVQMLFDTTAETSLLISLVGREAKRDKATSY